MLQPVSTVRPAPAIEIVALGNGRPFSHLVLVIESPRDRGITMKG
jgi:hypothetical protein